MPRLNGGFSEAAGLRLPYLLAAPILASGALLFVAAVLESQEAWLLTSSAVTPLWLAGVGLTPRGRSAKPTLLVYALCSLWAFVLGYLTYWSTWAWARYLDLGALVGVALGALAAVLPGKPSWRLALHAVPLVLCLTASYVGGQLTCGFNEDPRM